MKKMYLSDFFMLLNKLNQGKKWGCANRLKMANKKHCFKVAEIDRGWEVPQSTKCIGVRQAHPPETKQGGNQQRKSGGKITGDLLQNYLSIISGVELNNCKK